MCLPESSCGIDAVDSARPKLFEPSFCLRCPECFNLGLKPIVETGDQTLSQPHAIPQG